MKAYKLTDQDMQTRGGCQWVLGEWKETSGEGDLCGPGWLHFYTHPLLAILLNPMHANISHPRLFRVAVKGRTLDDYGLEAGYTKARLIEEVPLPSITTKQRVAFAILCARTVFFDKTWIAWADAWTSGENRTEAAAWAAAKTAAIEAEAAKATAQTTTWAVVEVAAKTAAWAAWAAWAAAKAAAWATTEAEAEVTVAWVATAAAVAAMTVAEAAAWAAIETAKAAAGKLDLIALAIAALEIEK